jgi:hypothetical protein
MGVNMYHSDVQPRVEVLSYSPGTQDSDDLEAVQRTVNAAAKPALADYSKSLTIPAPADERWRVRRVGVRLALTIDSISAGTLSGSIQVNGTERKSFTLSGAGEKMVAFDLLEGQFVTGTPNLYDIFLWVDSGEAVISQCRLWQGVGSTDNGYNYLLCLQVRHQGWVQWMIETNRLGAGSSELRIGQGDGARPSCFQAAFSAYTVLCPPAQLSSDNGIGMRMSTPGDLGSFFGPVKVILYKNG